MVVSTPEPMRSSTRPSPGTISSSEMVPWPLTATSRPGPGRSPSTETSPTSLRAGSRRRQQPRQRRRAFSPTVNISGDVKLDFDDSDAISSGNNAGAAPTVRLVATCCCRGLGGERHLTNTTGDGAVIGGLSQVNDIDSNSAVGTCTWLLTTSRRRQPAKSGGRSHRRRRTGRSAASRERRQRQPQRRGERCHRRRRCRCQRRKHGRPFHRWRRRRQCGNRTVARAIPPWPAATSTKIAVVSDDDCSTRTATSPRATLAEHRRRR